MTILDVIMILLFVAGAVMGYMRGLIKQMSTIVGFVVGIIACNMFGDKTTEVLIEVVPSAVNWPLAKITTHALAVIILFVVVWLSAKVLGFFMRNTIEMFHLGVVDKVGGAAMCVVKYFFVLSILLNLWLLISPKSEVFTTEHMLGNEPFEMTLNMVPWVLGQDGMPGDSLQIAEPAEVEIEENADAVI